MQRHGVERVIYELEGVLLHSPLSSAWLGLKPSTRSALLKTLRRLFRTHCVDTELMRALASDVLVDGRVATELAIYRYLKKVYYRNNTREMLIALRTVLEKEKNERD